ncbi:MAG: putative archaeal flagellar protein F [halophilic archaeon J07HB67]|jgi:Putative archaeal flagellar protein F|nr:MAG: putative archaeal flagellar protein F [halophilic archaeon J07HB67]
MGISVSASTAVVFLGVFVAAGTLYPAVSNGVEEVTDARQTTTDRALEQKNTAINVTSVEYNTTGDGILEVRVENTGTTAVSVPETNLLVDGNPNSTRDSYTPLVGGSTSSDVLLPGEELKISVDPGFSPGVRPSRVKVVVDHGVSEFAEVA